MPRAVTLPAAEKVKRDAEVVRLRLELPNATWAEIAERVTATKPTWKIAESTCRAVWTDWQKESREDFASPDMVEVVHEHVAGFRLLRQQAAENAREAAGGVATRIDQETGEEKEIRFTPQPHLVLGGIKLIAELREKEIKLLQQSGLLPHNLGTVQLEIDYRETMEVVYTILQKYVPAADQEQAELELLDALEERLPSGALARG